MVKKAGKRKEKSISRSGIAILLSKLEVFPSPDPKLEQYPTDSEIAADVLWQAYMLGDIKGRTIADLGCGTGILGIGALLLGAKKVFFVDKDTAALGVLGNNLEKAGIRKGFSIVDSEIGGFDTPADTVLQNPPFGTRDRHADREFLVKAFSIADVVYSFHKTGTAGFVEALAGDHGFSITERFDFDFPLKQTLRFHKKRMKRIEVSCFRLGRLD